MSSKIRIIHQSVTARAGTYQILPHFLCLQAGVECGGAEVIVLLPAEGGRDVEDTGCTY